MGIVQEASRELFIEVSKRSLAVVVQHWLVIVSVWGDPTSCTW